MNVFNSFKGPESWQIKPEAKVAGWHGRGSKKVQGAFSVGQDQLFAVKFHYTLLAWDCMQSPKRIVWVFVDGGASTGKITRGMGDNSGWSGVRRHSSSCNNAI
ncbi:unnamed protein product [Brassica rapa subsp. narinosa]